MRDAGGKYLQVIDERPKGRPVTADDYRRLGRLLTDARNAGETCKVIAANRVDHFIRGHAAEYGDRELRSNATDRDQLFKKTFFSRPKESIERNRVFAHMGMNVQRYFAANSG